MPIEQHRYGRFETWRLGVLWRAETADYGRTWAANGETEAEALANLAELLLADYEDRYSEYA